MTELTLEQIKQENKAIFSQQKRYLTIVAVLASSVLVYYFLFFTFFGVSSKQFEMGNSKIMSYFLHMFVWRDFLGLAVCLLL